MQKYMDINQFLDTYFRALSNKKHSRVFVFINAVQGLLNYGGPDYWQSWLFDMQDSLSEDDKALFEQYIAAMQDNSPAAKDFLNMVQIFTFFNSAAAQDMRQDRETKARVIIDAAQNGAIKNPLYSYKLLKQIPEYALSKETDKARWLTISQNPYATTDDAAEYAKYSNSREELLKLIDDFKIKIENALDPELDKDVKNTDNIKAILDNNYDGLNKMLLYLRDLSTHDKQLYSEMEELRNEIYDKFSMQNILAFKSGNYIKQYKESSEMQLASIKPELVQAKQQLVNAQDSEHQLNLALGSAQLEIQKLQEQLKQKDEELKKAKTENGLLKGKVTVFIQNVEKRMNGSILNKGHDIANLAKTLKQDISK